MHSPYHVLNDLTDSVASLVVEDIHPEDILVTLPLLDSPFRCELMSVLGHDPLVVRCVFVRWLPAYTSVLVPTRILIRVANVDPVEIFRMDGLIIQNVSGASSIYSNEIRCFKTRSDWDDLRAKF